MDINDTRADLACRDLAASIDWYASLFDRAPDARPCENRAEWYHGGRPGLRLVKDDRRAGRGTASFLVSNIATRRERLDPLDATEVDGRTFRALVKLTDPDGNLVLLVTR